MKFNIEVFLNIFVFTSTFWIIAKSEYFALMDLEPLLKTEGEVVKTLEKYLEMEEIRLEKVRRFKEEYEKLYKSAISDVDTFLSHPVNSYLLVKRLTEDWKSVLSLVEDSVSKAIIQNMTHQEVFPNEDDLDGASSALLRLQNTYLLNTTELARGEIAGKKASSELTVGDCFELGLHAHSQKDHYHSLLWMQETLDRLEDEEIKTIDKTSPLEYMAFSAYKLGYVQYALKLTKDIIKLDPNHENAQLNVLFYAENLLEKGSTPKIDYEKNPFRAIKKLNYKELDDYDRLCRGYLSKSPAEDSKLLCRYTTNNRKYLLLQPVKEEVLNLDPWIVMYHDVIRDNDIDLLKKLALPKLERAAVLNRDTGAVEVVKYRVSMSGWLDDIDHQRVAQISLKIQEITGLATETAESLQINKYGMAGHYAAHYDFRRPDEFDAFKKHGKGNRIATWLFYLSDVDAGGSTVFPEIEVQVKPIKGSAAFWFNLKKSGDGDFKTKHAACPVLAGTKWVANKWFHEKDQEFRRPCSLNRLE